MVKLRVTHGFCDLEAEVHRKPGEVFEASETRAMVVVSAGVAEVIEAVSEVPSEHAATALPDKRSRKRK